MFVSAVSHVYYLFCLSECLESANLLVSLFILYLHMYFSPPHIVCDNNFLTNQGSVHFSYSVVSSSLRTHGLQHTRTPSPSPTPRFLRLVSVESVMLSSVSSSVMPFSSHHQSFPASRSFQISQFFSSGGQTIGVSGSASVLPVNIQD